MTKITKLVVPAAGYGTRFLPWTKSMPKEMLPVEDRPLIDYIVREAVESGIKDIIFITSANKKPLEDYFDRNLELEAQLEKSGKLDRLQAIRNISEQANFIFIRQKEMLGNGHAILQARPALGNQPFAVAWGDEIFDTQPPRLKQIIDAYQKHPGNIITLVESPPDKHSEWCDKYGNASGKEIEPNFFQIEKIIEKPGANQALSNLFTFAGAVFEPEYLDALSQTQPGKSGEIWWNDGFADLVKQGKVFGKVVGGKYLDLGNPLGYIKTNLHFNLKNLEFKQEISDML